jgi:hypothetical protein
MHSTRIIFCIFLCAAITGAAIRPGHADASTPQPSPSKAASTQFIFDPPAGWLHFGTVGDGLGTWLHSGDPVYSQNVSAQATTFNGKLADIVTKEIAYIQGEFDDVTMKPIEQTTICGKHPATYFSYTFDAKNTQVVAEQIVTVHGSRRTPRSTIARSTSSLTKLQSIPCGRFAAATRQDDRLATGLPDAIVQRLQTNST